MMEGQHYRGWKPDSAWDWAKRYFGSISRDFVMPNQTCHWSCLKKHSLLSRVRSVTVLFSAESQS